MARVRSIHKSLASMLDGTFINRKGKSGRPLLPIGHYGGVVDIGRGNALTLHTDGVGTKVLVAQKMRVFDTVGIDCIAMTVNDLICLGSEPIAILDYIALQRENELLVEEITKGLVEGARRAEVAIVGGETAILGDVIRGVGGNGFDLASMGVGLVRSASIIDGTAIEDGDSILGVASSGLHSNGYTLARKALKTRSLDEKVDDLGSTLGEALLTPTSIYVRPALDAIRRTDVHGIAHVTGGAFTKLTRLTGKRRLAFHIDLPPPPPIFAFLMGEAGIAPREMYRTFNMGVGLCLILPEKGSGKSSRAFKSAGFETFDLGTVKAGEGVHVNGVRIS